ncbi:MAG: hypothetical protein RJB15_260, partial [Pseudomonadota bacterium]
QQFSKSTIETLKIHPQQHYEYAHRGNALLMMRDDFLESLELTKYPEHLISQYPVFAAFALQFHLVTI